MVLQETPCSMDRWVGSRLSAHPLTLCARYARTFHNLRRPYVAISRLAPGCHNLAKLDDNPAACHSSCNLRSCSVPLGTNSNGLPNLYSFEISVPMAGVLDGYLTGASESGVCLRIMHA